MHAMRMRNQCNKTNPNHNHILRLPIKGANEANPIERGRKLGEEACRDERSLRKDRTCYHTNWHSLGIHSKHIAQGDIAQVIENQEECNW